MKCELGFVVPLIFWCHRAKELMTAVEADSASRVCPDLAGK